MCTANKLIISGFVITFLLSTIIACGPDPDELARTMVAETVTAQVKIDEAVQQTLSAQATATLPLPATTVTLTETPLPSSTPALKPSPPTQTPVPTLVNPDQVVEIRVHTVTGSGGSGTCYSGLSVDGGGTDSTVVFYVNTATEVHSFKLDDPKDENDREEGDYNIYRLTGSSLLSHPIYFPDIVAIALDTDGRGHCPNWLVQEVTVNFDLKDGRVIKLYFHNNCSGDPESALPHWIKKSGNGLFWPRENWSGCFLEK